MPTVVLRQCLQDVGDVYDGAPVGDWLQSVVEPGDPVVKKSARVEESSISSSSCPGLLRFINFVGLFTVPFSSQGRGETEDDTRIRCLALDGVKVFEEGITRFNT